MMMLILVLKCVSLTESTTIMVQHSWYFVTRKLTNFTELHMKELLRTKLLYTHTNNTCMPVTFKLVTSAELFV